MDEEEKVDTEVLKLRLLSVMIKQLESLERLELAQLSKGEVQPVTVSLDPTITEIEPGNGKWKSASVYNAGPNIAYIQINRRSLLNVHPVTIGVGASKEFSYTTNVIEYIYAKAEAGGTASLEIEFTR